MINFICFIGEVNFTLQTGPALFKFTRTRLLYNFAGKSYLISRLVVIWLAYIRIQWKISKLATLSATLLFLSLGYRRYCGWFLWKWMKNNPFWMHRFFSKWKILMIQIFDLILDNFSKEIRPKYQYII